MVGRLTGVRKEGSSVTIDDIVTDVTHELTKTEEGKKRVGVMDKLVMRLNARNLLAARRLLRRRPGISFSVNTTQARSNRLTISVRASGVDCGVVSFGPERWMFKRGENFKHRWTSNEPALVEWRAREVSRFVEDCVCEALGVLEVAESPSRLSHPLAGRGAAGWVAGCRTPIAQPRSRRSPHQLGSPVRASIARPCARWTATRACAASGGTAAGAGTSGIGRPHGVLKRSVPLASRTTP